MISTKPQQQNKIFFISLFILFLSLGLFTYFQKNNPTSELDLTPLSKNLQTLNLDLNNDLARFFGKPLLIIGTIFSPLEITTQEGTFLNLTSVRKVRNFCDWNKKKWISNENVSFVSNFVLAILLLSFFVCWIFFGNLELGVGFLFVLLPVFFFGVLDEFQERWIADWQYGVVWQKDAQIRVGNFTVPSSWLSPSDKDFYMLEGPPETVLDLKVQKDPNTGWWSRSLSLCKPGKIHFWYEGVPLPDRKILIVGTIHSTGGPVSPYYIGDKEFKSVTFGHRNPVSVTFWNRLMAFYFMLFICLVLVGYGVYLCWGALG